VNASTDWVSATLQWVSAVGILLAGIAAVVGAVRTGRVHREVSTGNGRTLGEQSTSIANKVGAAE
jgi:hypothetical protein